MGALRPVRRMGQRLDCAGVRVVADMSETLERYKLEIVNNHGDRYIRCEPAPDGSWVMFKDVAALQARCKEAERERAHQHGRADRNAAEYAHEQAKREALQARVAELEEALKKIRNHARTGRPPFMSTKTDYFQIASAALEGKKDV